MLKKSKSVLLISSQPSFCDSYKKLAESVNVIMFTESTWNTRYRVKDDLVILGGKYLQFLNESYYDRVVVILGTDESPAPYIKQGIKRFIFNYKNNYELLTALYYDEPKLIISKTSSSVAESIADSRTTSFQYHDYDFKFDRGVFFYKRRPIYLTDAQRRYLAEWLLTGNKDNARRMVLCNLRKKFGADFLADVDRFGQPRYNEINRRKEDE